MPFGLHPAYLVILLAIVLIIFGPGKLPELGGAVGRGIREFRRASDGLTNPPADEAPEPPKAAESQPEPAAAAAKAAGDKPE